MATTAETNELVASADDIQSTLSGDDNLQTEDIQEDPNDGDDLEVESTWEDNDEGDDQVDENAPPARKAPQAVREVKANGKTHQVDLKDTAKLDRLLSLGLSAPKAYSELATARKEIATHKARGDEGEKYKKLWSNLEAAKSDPEALYEKIFNKPFKQAVDEAIAYRNASEEERALIDKQKHAERLEQRLADAERTAAEREKAAEEKSNQAEIREYKSRLTTSFRKYEFSSKVDDEVKAERLNKMLWRNVVADLKADYGDKDDIPQEVIERAFKEASELIGSTIEAQAKHRVKTITEEKKKTSKTQAQAAASRNYSNQDVSKLAKETDPVKLFNRMFKR